LGEKIPEYRQFRSFRRLFRYHFHFWRCKKKHLTKNFKGGQVFNVFGGVEIDLTQSDIDGIVLLDITQVFGGTKLIITITLGN
jgi:hypothetical protein